MSLTSIDFDGIEAVLIDVGGVFFIPHHEVLRPLLVELGVDAPAHDRFHRAHYEGIVHRVDDHDDDAFWRSYNTTYVRALGIGDDDRSRVADAIRQVWMSGTQLWSWRQDREVDALARLAKLLRLGIVSNADGTVEVELRRHCICQVGDGPAVAVEVIVDSTIVGVSKPDPEIFRFALEPMGLRPEQCLYVGDTYRYDIVGAQRAGLHPVLFDPYELHADAGVSRITSLHELADAIDACR
jgi:putative hydrolase of the HAD superfamily